MAIYLLKKLIRNNPFFGSSEMLTYLGIRNTCQNFDKDFFYISINQLLAELLGTCKVSDRIKEKMIDSIFFFQRQQWIEIVENISKTEWLIGPTPMRIDTRNEKYQLVDINDIKKIWSIKATDSKKVSLIEYYCILLTTLDYETFVGSSSCEQISELAQGISARTIFKYNQILEENKILYIYHTSKHWKNNDSIKALPNFYGRYDNKEFIDKTANQYIHDLKNGKVKKKKQINQLNLNPDELSPTAKEILTKEQKLYQTQINKEA